MQASGKKKILESLVAAYSVCANGLAEINKQNKEKPVKKSFKSHEVLNISSILIFICATHWTDHRWDALGEGVY